MRRWYRRTQPWGVILLLLTVAAPHSRGQQDTEIVSGNVTPWSYRLVPSTQPSQYLRSLTSASFANPVAVRILGARIAPDTPHVLEVRCAVIDAAGNALAGLVDSAGSWSIELASVGGSRYSIPAVAQHHQSLWVSTRLRLALCIDASIAMTPFSQAVLTALDSVQYALGPYDSLAIVLSGTRTHVAIPFTLRSALGELSERIRPALRPRGLNRLLHATLQTLTQLQPTAIIVIAASNDHASIDVLPQDVIDVALQHGTPIYCLALGGETLAWEAVATATGGRLYHMLPPVTGAACSNVLVEIIRGLQLGSTLRGEVPTPLHLDSTYLLVVRYRTVGLSDSLLLLPRSAAINPSSQMVGLFDFGSATLDSLYYPLLDALTEVLTLNPTQSIELIAHSFEEGEAEVMRTLALERGRVTRRYLVTRGVAPNRVRIRAMGDLKPLIPMPLMPEEYTLNRRVEFRWLDTALLPYELVVHYTYRERDALEQLERWERRGYRAYIEEVQLGGTPAFRVKLWGYATLEEARAAAAQIERLYHTSISIE